MLAMAIEETYRQIAERPDDGRIRYELAGLLIAAGRYEKARSRSFPTSRYEEARSQLLAAQPLMPEYQWISVSLSAVALEMGDPELAYQLAVTAVETFPLFPLKILAETAVAARRIDEARTVLEHLYRDFPADLRESEVEKFLVRPGRQRAVADWL
jgi:tetratricopeptide (TPR) repeat protein